MATESFTVAIIPDTQYYCDLTCGGTPEMYQAEMDWILERAEEDRTRFAIHLGDLVNNAEVRSEWDIADACQETLEWAVPYSVCPGNHDLGPSDYYNEVFGPERFEDQWWYGGHYGTGNENNYCIFRAEGMRFLVLSLNYRPDEAELAWADRVVKDHPQYRVIIATHEYLGLDGRRPSGDAIWNNVVRENDNVFMVVSGHISGWAHQTSVNDYGHDVTEILTDYQWEPDGLSPTQLGGDGWLNTLEFVPLEDKIFYRSYSPWLDEWRTTALHEFTIDYEMDIAGDMDGDNFVGSSDLDAIRAHWGETVVPGCLESGDATGDGRVASDDLDRVRENWGEGCGAAAVPEPSWWGLLLLTIPLGIALRSNRVERKRRSFTHLPGTLCVGLLLGSALVAGASEETDPRIEKAFEAIRKNAPAAASDPNRPTYHYCPPSGWISDPVAPLFENGYYHIFYIHNPYGPKGWPHSRNHWGHARSKDLVHWEHLPPALAPEADCENRCNSGCGVFTEAGTPVLFYTHVPNRGPNEQWAALGSDALRVWTKRRDDPVLTLETHGGPQFNNSWRDPFVFRDGSRTFMTLCAHLGREAVLPLYEATDQTLLEWKYRGMLWRVPKAMTHSLECPNFFRIGSKWVLIGSPQKAPQAVRYFVGSFDSNLCRFTPETQGYLAQQDNFLYATTVLQEGPGAPILFARLKHFRTDHGWSGCLALPRRLSLAEDGTLRQRPIAALEALRGKSTHIEKLRLDDEAKVLPELRGDAMEIAATFKRGTAKAFGLNVRRADDGSEMISIRCEDGELSFYHLRDGKPLPVSHHGDRPKSPGGILPIAPVEPGKSLTLRVFLDKAVMEVFVGDGEACAARTVYPKADSLGVEAFAEGGWAELVSLDAWRMAAAEITASTTNRRTSRE